MYVLGSNRDQHRHRRQYRGFKIAINLLVAIVVVSAGFVALDIWRDRRSTNVAVSKTQKIEQVASSETYRTDYFQFTFDKGWVFDEKDSTKTKFVYRKIRSELIEHELNVYVNEKVRFEATHVMPVGVDGETKLLAGPVSEHCKSTFPPKGGNRNPADVKLANTSLLCNPDDIRYRLVLGLVNGGNEIKLKRANGELATYVITYQDLTFNNSGLDLKKLVNSFEAR